MKIIDYALANTALVVSLDDVRPVHGFLFPQLISELSDRYAFSGKPNLASPTRMQVPRPDGLGLTIAQGPWVFENGKIDVQGKTVAIPRLELAPDFSLVVVHTSTTDEGETILDDIAAHLEQTFGFRDIMKTSKKRFSSNIVFEFDPGTESGIQMISELERAISPALKKTTEINLDAKLDRISFSFDPLDIPSSKVQQNITFVIERRAGRSFRDNRWYSGAPIRTADHSRVLEEIEGIFRHERF